MREPFLSFIDDILGEDTLLIACGLPASWKTETTEEVAKLKGYKILRTDLLRLEVLRDKDIFDEEVASNFELRTRVYDEMFGRAAKLLETEPGVILDATFVTQRLRRRAAKLAAEAGSQFVILQTQCPPEVSLARIARRTKEDYESNALTSKADYNNVERFEEVDLDDLKRLGDDEFEILHLIVDTTEDPPEEWYIVEMERR